MMLVGMPHDDHVWVYRLREIVREKMGLAEAAEHLQQLLAERLAAIEENVRVTIDGSEMHLAIPLPVSLIGWRA